MLTFFKRQSIKFSDCCVQAIATCANFSVGPGVGVADRAVINMHLCISDSHPLWTAILFHLFLACFGSASLHNSLESALLFEKVRACDVLNSNCIVTAIFFAENKIYILGIM